MTAAVHDPGWLRHRVTLQAASGTPDGAGGESAAFTDIATVWARIEPAPADERAVAGHLASVITHRITIRRRDDVAGGMRAIYRGRSFRIAAVGDPDESGRTLVLHAVEEAP